MKRYIALLLCIAAACAAGCRLQTPQENVVFTGTIEQLYDNGILVNTEDDVGFDKASVVFAAQLALPFNLCVGQVVKLTILPQVAESYPVQVKAVALELVSQPDTIPGPAVSGPAATGSVQSSLGQVSYLASFYRVSAGGKAFEFFAQRAENAERLSRSSVQHIPVAAIRSAQELADFLEQGAEFFCFDAACGTVAFADGAKAYDDAFFSDSWLLLLYAQDASGSIRHEIQDAVISGETLSVVISAACLDVSTGDMADWLILLEFAGSDTAACSVFDAYYAA